MSPPARPLLSPVAVPASVRLEDLRVGDLLAEGGEGRVHQLPRQPHLVYKSYRHPVDLSHLEDLVSWPEHLEPDAQAVVRAASAWPCSVVTDATGEARGLLMPRAPRRFSLRHRDGHSRLASLSYLTADPQHRAAAYGLALPHPAAAERVGLAYALARLLATFDSARPAIGHGDLSTKNVLWSLQRGPEVFVIDCDNSDRFDADDRPTGPPSRRRAMTPNWDDPAVARGANPTVTTDRYSLALVFVRVVGAANFPIQARQRRGEPVELRFSVPPGPGSGPLLDPDAPVWRLVARSLSMAGHGERPAAAQWVGVLEDLLESMGGAEVAAAVRAAQGDRPANAAAPEGPASVAPRPVAGRRADPSPGPRDVAIIPVAAARREPGGTRPGPRLGPSPAPTVHIGYRYGPGAGRSGGPAAPTWVRPSGQRAMAPHSVAPGGPIFPAAWAELKMQLRRLAVWWVALHRTVLRPPAGSGRRPRRGRALIMCLVVDFVSLVLGGAAVALVVSPLIQH